MGARRPAVLSIAGFDPSGGAGVLADIKTFEQCRTLGMGISTSVTFQNESDFDGVKWMETEDIIRQAEALLRKYEFAYAKIGLVKELQVVKDILEYFSSRGLNTRFIWDPVVRASAGYTFHSDPGWQQVTEILKKLFLVTPNLAEASILTGKNDPVEAARELAGHCNVFLKGGHSEEKKGRDLLFVNGKSFSFRPKKIASYAKHGSGCVLSAALASYLARGFKLHPACLKAKEYVTKYLISNNGLLGYHK